MNDQASKLKKRCLIKERLRCESIHEFTTGSNITPFNLCYRDICMKLDHLRESTKLVSNTNYEYDFKVLFDFAGTGTYFIAFAYYLLNKGWKIEDILNICWFRDISQKAKAETISNICIPFNDFSLTSHIKFCVPNSSKHDNDLNMTIDAITFTHGWSNKPYNDGTVGNAPIYDKLEMNEPTIIHDCDIFPTAWMSRLTTAKNKTIVPEFTSHMLDDGLYKIIINRYDTFSTNTDSKGAKIKTGSFFKKLDYVGNIQVIDEFLGTDYDFNFRNSKILFHGGNLFLTNVLHKLFLYRDPFNTDPIRKLILNEFPRYNKKTFTKSTIKKIDKTGNNIIITLIGKNTTTVSISNVHANKIPKPDIRYHRIAFGYNQNSGSTETITGEGYHEISEIAIILPGEVVIGTYNYIRCDSLEEAKTLKFYLQCEPIKKWLLLATKTTSSYDDKSGIGQLKFLPKPNIKITNNEEAYEFLASIAKVDLQDLKNEIRWYISKTTK